MSFASTFVPFRIYLIAHRPQNGRATGKAPGDSKHIRTENASILFYFHSEGRIKYLIAQPEMSADQERGISEINALTLMQAFSRSTLGVEECHQKRKMAFN